MAFEQKRMDEADKALYVSWGVRLSFGWSIGNWTVDLENDIYFLSFGGQGDSPDPDSPPNYFLLRYKG